MPRPDATPVAEYKAQQGTPDQLPQGEATALNQAVTDIPNQGGQAAAPEMADDSTAPAQPADYEPIYTPESDDEDFLSGPTLRPDEAQFVGATPQQPLSAAARRSLPTLQAAAAEPGASDALKALVAALLREA